ncbi:hypothetical protein Scep_000179 [Stephania cephalantha]|uniref:Uncharacterized protein n=1 Tax=Stephania cephalantha TaxID=152367 RepID=A0AAP0L739_9MAGN
MPPRSHPSALTVEESLSMLKALWDSSSTLKGEKMCIGLAGLVELYNSVEDLLHLPITQQTLMDLHECEKWTDDVLEGSVRLLDVCSSTRDLLLQMKGHVHDLQSALRRKGGEAAEKDMEVDAYICFRKMMKTDLTKCLKELKSIGDSSAILLLIPHQSEQHHKLQEISRVLKESREITISTFQSLISIMSVPIKAKPSRWLLVSKLMHNRQLTGEREDEDLGLACVDNALYALTKQDEKENEMENVLKAHKGLEALEAAIEGVQVWLDCIFRQLIQNRVSLLNIFTQ